MRIHYIASALLASVTLASAQPAPEPAPAPPPADPATPPPTTEPTPLPEGPVVMPEHPPEEKKDEKPAVNATYDGGLKLSSADEQYELKLQFRNQLRFEQVRPLEGNQFINKFYLPRIRLQAEGHVFGKSNRYKLEVGLGDAGSFSFVKDVFVERKLADAGVAAHGCVEAAVQPRRDRVDFASTFNERSIQNELAGGGRDIGVAVHNEYEKSPEGLEWSRACSTGSAAAESGRTSPARSKARAKPTRRWAKRPARSTVCTRPAISRTTSRPPSSCASVGTRQRSWATAKAISKGGLRYAIGLAYKIDLANFSKGGEACGPPT